MKISIVGSQPLYVSKERGERIKELLMIGAEMFEVDGNLYKSSSVMSITNESSPAQWGRDVDKQRLPAPKYERADESGDGYKKYLAAKERLMKKVAK